MDGITNISANGQSYIKTLAPDAKRHQTETPEASVRTVDPVVHEKSILDVNRELAAIAPALNQRLEFSFHKELGQVIVKIIDRETDTVIKELPPTEFQRVHIALREAIGLLIDKKV
jgi:flagellar protein FlaG